MVIEKVAIVGMGALGMLYGEAVVKACGSGALRFVMDKKRYQRHKNDVYKINGVAQNFILASADEVGQADLVIVATKYSGLAEALDEMEALVGPDTVVFSVLNGITSEEKIIERFGDRNVLYCVALGMDAVRKGTELTYEHQGMLKIGCLEEKQRPALEAACAFLSRIGVSYSVEKDIKRALWAKLLLNVGINQTCMVYETSYGGALSGSESSKSMLAAMNEVIDVAVAEGVHLTKEDVSDSVSILSKLAYDGLPSMRQDALAKRPSEVELFAGTVLRLAEKHGIAVPVNKRYYEKIKEIEAGY